MPCAKRVIRRGPSDPGEPLVRRALIALAAVLTAASAALAQPVQRPHPYWPQGFRPVAADVEEVEGLILERTNAFRREHGQAPLEEDARLTADARAFAAYLARTGKFSHTADGRTPADRANAVGYDYCRIAENIAFGEDSRGFQSETLAKMLMDGWAASPGHRRNLLDPEPTQIGVGVAAAAGSRGRYIAVQEFGRPASMTFAFQVDNDTPWSQSYVLGGRTIRITPNTVITHTLCVAEDLQAPGGPTLRPGPGQRYVLRETAGGHAVLKPAA